MVGTSHTKLKRATKSKEMHSKGLLPTIDIENRRYIGSKTKLLDWIFDLIYKHCQGESFADLFAGTGVVSARAATKFKKIVLNDILSSNIITYQGFFGKGSYDYKKILDVARCFNSLDPKEVKHTHFSRNFGGKYFNKDSAKLIGYIRDEIEKKREILSEKEYSVLITSLLYSADKIANTVGHYEAFFKRASNKKFVFRLIQPLINAKTVKIFKQDANALVRKIKADVVYIDPPYNSRQYSRFYHVLETLAKWDNPKLSGVALKRPEENMSEYCKNNAKNVFEDLIKNLESKYIVVSYNNTYKSKSHSSRNKIELEDIKKILGAKGETKVFKKTHKYFNAGKTDFNNHQEWLFITKVL